MVSYGSEDSVITVLPLGKKEDHYEIAFEITVSDSLSAATNIQLKITVGTRVCRGGAVPSCLVRLNPDQAVRVRGPTGRDNPAMD